MADVFVHIGYHKTGTTYLQRRIFDRHPRVQRPWGPEHLTRFFLWPDPLRFDAESTRASILSKASDGPLVLSCENLVGRAIHGGMMKRVLADRIQRTFPDARIIIGIRNQPETMVSLYKQYVRLGGTAPFGEFVRIGPPALVPLLRPSHLEYDRLIAHYRGLFGARRVHVMLQEDLAARTQATVDALTGFLGVEPLDAPQERVHASFDDRTVESLRRRNLRSWNPDMHTFHGPGRWRLPIGRRVVLATRERLLRRQRETPTSAYLDQARKLAASHHAASNQRTADLLGRSDLGDLGYPMPAA